MKELNKIQVVDKKSHEIINEILGDYAGELEMVENYQLVIKLEKQNYDLELVLIMNIILMLLMKDVMQEMLFSTAFFIKSTLLN